MPVFHSDIDFARAYQDHILREAKLVNISEPATNSREGLRDRLLLYIGEGLINLGCKIMPDQSIICIETLPERA